MNILTIPINTITILPERQRTEYDDKYIDQLSESIRIIGLINPIIIDESNTLIAGFCRIKAHELLGRTEIVARRWDDLDSWEKELIELEENIRRKNLTYNEQLLAELRLHERFKAYYGKKPGVFAHTSTGRSKWRLEDMATFMGYSTGKMSERLKLAQEIKRDPALGTFKTESQARHAMERKHTQAIRTVLAAVKVQEQKEQLATIDEPRPQFETFGKDGITLINADSRVVIPTLPDESISCLITDPPWNVRFDETFGGDPNEGFALTSEVLTLLHPKLQLGSLCVLYCATKHLITGRIYELVQSCGYAIYPTIHIWYKPHVAASSIPYRELKNDYEPALLFSKGPGRDFNAPMFSIIQGLVEGKRVHSAQKCIVVLSELINNFTVPGELIIDPFMGCGSTMLACKQTGRRGIGIELTSDQYHNAVFGMES